MELGYEKKKEKKNPLKLYNNFKCKGLIWD